MNNDKLSSAVIMDDMTLAETIKTNQSLLDNNRIEVIEGEEIQSLVIQQSSKPIINNDDHDHSNMNDSDNVILNFI